MSINDIPDIPYRKGGSLMSFGHFSGDGGDAIISMFTRRLMVLKASYRRINFIKLKTKIDVTSNLDDCLNQLRDSLDKIIRISDFTFMAEDNGKIYVKSTIPEGSYDPDVIKVEFKNMMKELDFQKVNDMRRFKKMRVLTNNFCDSKSFNYAMKIERVNVNSSFPSLFLMHTDSKYADAVLSDYGISSNLVNLLVKYSDLVLKHDYADEVSDYLTFTEYSREFLDEIIINLETLMLPKLIQTIEETTEQECVYIQDADLKGESFKQVKNAIFFGVMNKNLEIPQIINEDTNDTYPLLNRIINVVWVKLRNWRVKENNRLEAEKILDAITGNYILTFNNDFELEHLNGIDRNALSTFFVFPELVVDYADLTLNKLVKHEIVKQNLLSLIRDAVEKNCTSTSLSRPMINIKINYDISGVFKRFSLIVQQSTLYQHKGNDFFTQFDYVLNGRQHMRRADTELKKNSSSISARSYKPSNDLFSDIDGANSEFGQNFGSNLVRTGQPPKKPSAFKKYMRESMPRETEVLINKQLKKKTQNLKVE